jgi:hypothetical protein
VAGRFAGVAENEGPRPSGFVQFQRRKAQSASPVFDDGQCRFRNLDSSIPMMEAAKDRMRNNVSDPLDQSRTGRVLAK